VVSPNRQRLWPSTPGRGCCGCQPSDRFEEIAAAAQREQLSYLGFLAELVMAECDDRDKRRAARRIHDAGARTVWTWRKTGSYAEVLSRWAIRSQLVLVHCPTAGEADGGGTPHSHAVRLHRR
jgi:hypothetical protein